MAEYVLSPEARVNLQGVWDFIALDSVKAADRVLEELFAAFEYLAEWPGIGHKRSDLTQKRHSFLDGAFLPGGVP